MTHSGFMVGPFVSYKHPKYPSKMMGFIFVSFLVILNLSTSSLAPFSCVSFCLHTNCLDHILTDCWLFLCLSPSYLINLSLSYLHSFLAQPIPHFFSMTERVKVT
uniref:Uncharacterized protein n=1 Tax=Octopus bimaculoides TaxID=37653 RepID=A0A0L8IGF4_OCTBM